MHIVAIVVLRSSHLIALMHGLRVVPALARIAVPAHKVPLCISGQHFQA